MITYYFERLKKIKNQLVLTFFIITALTYNLNANQDENQVPGFFDHICTRKTLTDGFLGLNDNLENNGIEAGFSVTNIYQQNIKGGLSTHRQAGRNSGSYDLEILSDLEKLIGLKGSSLYIHGEGGWTDTEGIDSVAVGSAFGINADAKGNRTLDIVECFYEGSLLDESLKVMAGKIDLTCVFDVSSYADCESTQFMNAALVDNPTIPFPECGLSTVLMYEHSESLYFMGGLADAQADSRETGFRTAFFGEDYFLYMFETGIKPEIESSKGTLPGTYRIGFWNDPQPKANSDSSKSYRDDVGFYISCDQLLIKENSQVEDNQGFGAFLRYGYANGQKNDINDFLSFGLQYQGIVDGRDDDVIATGFAKGFFSDKASITYPEDYESAFEMYYNASVTPWINISPSFQYITNPGGNNTASDALVVGLRAQILF